MTLHDLKCFMVLGETLSFTKASALLYISQPALSSHIQLLENELGLKLVERSNRRSVSLTEAGKIYHKTLMDCKKHYQNSLAKISENLAGHPVCIALLHGMKLPNDDMTRIVEYTHANRSFNMRIDFVDRSGIEQTIENGNIMILPKDLIPKNKVFYHKKITAEPVPYYVIASKSHYAFSEKEEDQMKTLGGSAVFLSDHLSSNSAKQLVEAASELLGQAPAEIFTDQNPNTVSQFLHGNRCYTIATGWQQELSDPGFFSLPLYVSVDFYLVYRPETIINPKYVEYLQYVFQV